MSDTFLLARVTVKYGKAMEFNALMGELRPHAERHGWRLVGSYRSIIGELTEILDVWQVPDANAVIELRANLQAEPETIDLARRLSEIVTSEELTLADQLPFSLADQS